MECDIGPDCPLIRESLSACLDGEAGADEVATVQAHLGRCAGCRQWRRDAEALTRSLGLAPAPTLPPIPADLLAAYRPRTRDRLRGPAGARVRTVVRIALAAVAAVQLVVSILQLMSRDSMAAMDHLMPGMAHLDHESASWNLAVAAGFAWVVTWPRRGLGTLPLLGVFVGVLTVTCSVDLIDGSVGPARVVSHLPVLAGFLLSLLVVVLHAEPRQPSEARQRRPDASGPAMLAPDDEAAPSRARLRRPTSHRSAG